MKKNKVTPNDLRAHRQKNNLTQQQLGELLGYSGKPGGRAIRAIENGERGLRGPTQRCFQYLAKYGPLE